MVVFREVNEYSGTPKYAYYVATMNACEGSGHTLAFQLGAHQVPPLGVFVTAGRCYSLAQHTRHVLAQHPSLWPCAGTAMPQGTPWNATLNPWCTSDSVDGTGGFWGFQGNMFLAMRGSTCEWHCLHAFQAWLWTSWRLGGILFWRVFILFLFVFNLGSIIIYSKHSEASSRAILELQLGLSLLHALVHLYRVNWRLKIIKYSICLRCCFYFIFFKYLFLYCFSTTVCWNYQAQGITVKLKWNRNYPGSKNACKIC